MNSWYTSYSYIALLLLLGLYIYTYVYIHPVYEQVLNARLYNSIIIYNYYVKSLMYNNV